jgi:predicted negative regulator of RcsB-dependent stress response
MSKYTRKQRVAPQDEFVGFWDKVFHVVEPYLRTIGVSILTAAVLIGVVWGVTGWLESRAQAATEQLGHIVRTYQAELLVGDEQPQAKSTDEDNPIPRFKTAEERGQSVLKQLDELDQKHRGSAASKEGKLFRAGVLFDLGRVDEAATAYDNFLVESKHSPMVTLAREGLGLCKEQQGKLDEALAEYQKLEPKTGDFFRDRALWDEARVLAKKGDKKQAAEKLKELVAKVPASPLKDEAQTQIAQLEGQ